MYFKPCYVQGSTCHDGGLKANNPVQTMVNESKEIWGRDRDVPFDLILSVGSGQAKLPPEEPNNVRELIRLRLFPSWLITLFSTFINTMNGEDAWKRFCRDNTDRGIRDRSSRLNVKLDGNREPALDDIDAIPGMERVAENYHFPYKASTSSFSPIYGTPEGNMLQSLADRLRASLYFFQVSKISGDYHSGFNVEGWICCRLLPTEKGFEKLLSQTVGFLLQGRFYSTPSISGNKPMKWEVSFSEQDTKVPIRIDANFGASHSVSISGFPMTLEVGSVPTACWDLINGVANMACFIDVAISF